MYNTIFERNIFLLFSKKSITKSSSLKKEYFIKEVFQMEKCVYVYIYIYSVKGHEFFLFGKI